MSSNFPFLFYGHTPSDWRDRTHLWVVRFAANLDAAARLEMAGAIGRLARRLPVTPTDFLFSGAWMAFLAEEGPDAAQDGRAARLFKAMEGFFLALHAQWPLAEVVHGSSLARGVGKWDAWTHAQQAEPSPQPAWPFADGERVCRYGAAEGETVGRATDAAPGAPDAAFSLALRDALGALEAQRAAAAAVRAQSTADAGKPALVEAPAPPPTLPPADGARVRGSRGAA